MKKKGLAVLLAAVSCLAVPVTAMAEEAEQTITVNLTADPTYTVTIPSSVSMDQNGTAVDVVAEDVENLQEGQKISVTIAGTSYYRNQLVVEADREDVSAGKVRQLRYQIISDDGELIETTGQDTAVVIKDAQIQVQKEVFYNTGPGRAAVPLQSASSR